MDVLYELFFLFFAGSACDIPQHGHDLLRADMLQVFCPGAAMPSEGQFTVLIHLNEVTMDRRRRNTRADYNILFAGQLVILQVKLLDKLPDEYFSPIKSRSHRADPFCSSLLHN